MQFLPRNEAREKIESTAGMPKGKINNLKTIVGTVANFYPAKGLENIIETAKYFSADSDVSFIIIGDGMEREKLQSKIKAQRLEDKIFLTGNIKDAQKHLTAFDIFILPSLKEGFPWALIEAMAAKLPVIASLVGAVPEIIENGKNGFIVDPGHPEQIAMRIKEILNSDSLRKELSIQAHQTVLFNFPLDKMISKTEALL
jgi:glycosyltransferase involved in cell wall biosynthesis